MRVKKGLWIAPGISTNERDLIEKSSKSHLGIVLTERLVVDMLEVEDVLEEKSYGKHGEHQIENIERCFFYFLFLFFCSLNSRKNKENNFLLLSKNEDLKTRRTIGNKRTPTSQTCFLFFIFYFCSQEQKDNSQKHQPNREVNFRLDYDYKK